MTSLLQRLVGRTPFLPGSNGSSVGFPLTVSEAHPRHLYAVLRAYYEGNATYDALIDLLRIQGETTEKLKALRSPAYRVVEFHASHLWPGTLPEALEIATENTAIIDPIRQVWEWSNWGARKQVAARWLAIYGDLFIKVVQREDRQRVYFQLIRPEYVSDFDTDEREYVTYLRLDVPITDRQGEKLVRKWHTEVWDKANNRFRVWKHERHDAPLGQLGTPERDESLSAFGIDFVPFVQAKFKDTGDPRGVGAFTLQLDKIDEANRQATNLYSMLFRNARNVWALRANGMDPTGRPLPAPRVRNEDQADGAILELGDNSVIRLPGTSELQSLVPNLPYDAALHILQDYLHELEQDLPELAYARVREQTQISGRAVRFLLSDAVDRVLEARGNAESALVRVDQMALTLGQNAGLFANLGTFEAGDFAHAFAKRDVLPTDDLENAQAEQAWAQAGATWQTAGLPIEEFLKRERGWTDEELTVLGAARAAQIKRDQLLAQEDVVPEVEQ